MTDANNQAMPRFDMPGYDALEEIALNLRFSWNHKGDMLWSRLDADLWERTRNPWIILQTASKEKLQALLNEPEFHTKVLKVVEEERERAKSEAWFQKSYSSPSLTTCAYFSMEYMLSEALPIYSGGLGNVAGDQLKAASDLGVPIVGVGLLFQQGYFRQVIDKKGKQDALYPYNSPVELPIQPVRDAKGQWLRINFNLPGYPIWLRTWEVKVGRLKLYLLDSNDPANFPAHRGITSELYGGGAELRLIQEIILGIGGYRLLSELGIKPEICHLNEGHAAFCVLERAHEFMQENSVPFDVALTATRAGNLFTTHTAVAAAFDLFSPELMAQPELIAHYCEKYANEKLGITLDRLLSLGRKDPKNKKEPFNMAYLAMNGCGSVNGVSELHQTVSQRIFSPLFPRWPEAEIPIGHVTNGVHMPSWDSKEADALWTTYCGKDRWLGPMQTLPEDFRKVPDEALWQMRNASRKTLIEYARQQLVRQLEVRGTTAEEIEAAKHIFDPNSLTIGFARRFATYKRPNMLLQDPDRLARILTNHEFPVQLIIAGKAHPKDIEGQALIEKWMQFIKRPEIRSHVIFISDYDIRVAEQLVGGVDLWVNTPRRPWEACGTSGMKVLVNGGINLSELDGWWQEAYSPKVGWAIGDKEEHGEDVSWDRQEAERLYEILENEVVPQFYTRDPEGLPQAWIEKMRESMATLTPQFSAERAVREYTQNYYIPQSVRYKERTANNCQKSKDILKWQQALAEHWEKIRFVDVHIETAEELHIFTLQIYLDDLSPDTLKLELYADPLICQEMTLLRKTAASPGIYIYTARVSATRPSSDYTPRVVPACVDVAVPLEEARILWKEAST